PTFYGVKSATKVTTITETVSTYVPTTATSELENQELKVSIFPNPTNELIAIQLGTLSKGNTQVQLIDMTGRVVKETQLFQGSTIAYFETATLHSGTYSVRISDGRNVINRKVVIAE
ncbi:MAG TPA: T9SS type A sorting domain-containing protein, partial [Catalimonadaceae bacterium]|nr:T9SS type A sorting domain-containing protein [Catalimonadaceae bacterium]